MSDDILQDLFGKEEKEKSSRKTITTTRSYKPKKHPTWLLAIIDSFCKQYSNKKRTKNSGRTIKEALEYLGMSEEELQEEVKSWVTQ